MYLTFTRNVEGERTKERDSVAFSTQFFFFFPSRFCQGHGNLSCAAAFRMQREEADRVDRYSLCIVDTHHTIRGVR